jgi:hypothetical protein
VRGIEGPLGPNRVALLVAKLADLRQGGTHTAITVEEADWLHQVASQHLHRTAPLVPTGDDHDMPRPRPWLRRRMR